MDKQGLVLNGIGKQFYGITVLSDIDFEILPGEIHGLLGENGAGKSTLMKIINGALTPTTGDIYIDGEKMSFDSPHAAANHGIRMVYQELDLFPHLTVAENICQGNIPKNKAGMVDWKEMERVSKELSILFSACSTKILDFTDFAEQLISYIYLQNRVFWI